MSALINTHTLDTQIPDTQSLAPINENNQQLITSLPSLFEFLAFSEQDATNFLTELNKPNFPFRVPVSYAQKIQKNNINDPLLKQILPTNAEWITPTNYTTDPLGEQQTNQIAGLIHKYKTRVLLTATNACGIHCRYCFRQHYDYQQNVANTKNWTAIANYISAHADINEVILSGGDPLALTNDKLFALLDNIETLNQIKTIRIHSRQAIAMPERLDDRLLNRLQQSHCKIVLVTHANHPNEIGDYEHQLFKTLAQTNITLLNQSVLLKGINDDAQILTELSYKLFESGIMPYYLHLLDKVVGASHFEVAELAVQQIYERLLANLSGYLVPKLVREEAGKPNKTPTIF